MEVFEEPKQVKEKKKTKKELTEEKKKVLAERLVKAREILKQKKEAKKKETANVEKGISLPNDDNKVIQKASQGDAIPKPKKKKQVIIEQEVTSSEDESSSSEEEEVVIVKKKKERKSNKSDLNNEKLDGIFSAINELVSYKKTKIEAKNNYLKYQEAKLKSLNEEKPKSVEQPPQAKQEQPAPTPAPTPALPIEEPPEIILPSFKSLGNNRFNKRGF